MRDLFLDLSQLIHAPARSGIQRVICELLGHWRQEVLSADVGFLLEESYCTVDMEPVASALARLFGDTARAAGDAPGRGGLVELLAAQKKRLVPVDEIFAKYRGYLLPELTYRDDILDRLQYLTSLSPSRVLALFFDALPQTSPSSFMAANQLATSRYFRLVAELDNVACISRATLDCLTERLRRRPLPNGVWLELGADGLGGKMARTPDPVPTFLMLGTVEPRKNHHVVLGAFRELWGRGLPYRLKFIGSAGAHDSALISELRALTADGTGRLAWLETAADQDIRGAMAAAAAVIFVSEHEGYGLPAVEALAAGCPLIAHKYLPSLSNLPDCGQVRLDVVNARTIAAAIEDLARPQRTEALAAEVATLSLPTWDSFARSMMEWAGGTLAVTGIAGRG